MICINLSVFPNQLSQFTGVENPLSLVCDFQKEDLVVESTLHTEDHVDKVIGIIFDRFFVGLTRSINSRNCVIASRKLLKLHVRVFIFAVASSKGFHRCHLKQIMYDRLKVLVFARNLFMFSSILKQIVKLFCLSFWFFGILTIQKAEYDELLVVQVAVISSTRVLQERHQLT